MILIDGVLYQFINVLLLIMQSMGATPVAGTTGTTAGFLQHGPAAIERPAEFRSAARLR